MRRHRLLTIFTIVFVNMLGFGLILPLLPFYAETFNASGTVVGLLVASYAAAQMIGAPVLGRISDRYGRRPILLVSLLGSFFGFVLLGVANALWLLFASRILDGLTGGNVTVARAYITDVTDEKDRAKGMGLIGAAFGLGFIIGPAVGGLLSAGERYALPAFVAAALTALNLLAVYLWLPESLGAERRAELAARERETLSLRSLQAALSRPRVGPMLQMAFVFGLALAIFEGVFTLYAQKHLGLESDQTGYVLAYVGLLVALVQGAAIGRLAARFPEERLLLGAAAAMTISLIGWAYAPTVLAALVALAPLSLAIGVLSATIHTALTKIVPLDEVGGILGLAAALSSLARAVGPATGGALFDLVGAWAPGMAAAVLMSWLVWQMWRQFIPAMQRPLPGLEQEGSPR
jgi:DHA1 family tetracycline resistance protein-like MFS transporter